ncbi:MAG: DUF6754 domain-containing protein, partial [Chthonomonadales bacterium]
MDHSDPVNSFVIGLICIVILAMIRRARSGANVFIRRIPGLDAMDEAVGRATEMGRPMLLVSGLGNGIDVVTLQALAIIANVAKAAARFGNRIIAPVYKAEMIPVTEEAMREAYASVGREENFKQDDIIFLTDRQFAFAAGVAGIIQREKVAATFLFGYFYAESLIMAENANQVGAIQIAGTVQTTQIPFLVAACDYVIIGDEFYAATAFLTREPTLVGSLVGQDFGKALILVACIIGVLLATLSGPHNFFADWFNHNWWT